MTDEQGGPTPADNSLLEGVYTPEAPSHAAPGPREFKQWHRPRKQYVRSKQWQPAIEALLDERPLDSPRLLRYVTLPGEDMLDVRVLNEICAARDIKLRVLGFNNELETAINASEFNISSNEIAGSSSIDRESHVLPDDIRRICENDSLAALAADMEAPFDVINLDLCGSVAKSEPLNTGSYYDVIQKLATLQAIKNENPWLLFLTTQASMNSVHDSTREVLMQCIDVNMSNSQLFAEELNGLAELEDGDIREFVNGKSPKGDQFLKLFGVGLGKWLLRLVGSSTPSWQARLLSCCWYRVARNNKPNMASFVFRFDQVDLPPRVNDSMGLAQPVILPEEVRMARRLLPPIKKAIDLDNLMKRENALKVAMVSDTKTLLCSARYDTDKYDAWLAKNS